MSELRAKRPVSPEGIKAYLAIKSVQGDARVARRWLGVFYQANKEAILQSTDETRRNMGHLFAQHGIETLKAKVVTVADQIIELFEADTQSELLNPLFDLFRLEQSEAIQGKYPKGTHEQRLTRIIKRGIKHEKIKELWNEWVASEQEFISNSEDPRVTCPELIHNLREKGPSDQGTMDRLNEWTQQQETQADKLSDRDEGSILINLNRARLYLAAGLLEYADENFNDVKELARQLGRDFLAFLIGTQRSLDFKNVS